MVDNPITTVSNTDVITVEDDGTDNAMRKYKRVQKLADVSVTEFDGEGLVSFQYAKKIDTLFCGEDVRFLAEMGVSQIKDMWGVFHNMEDVDIILTKSMFIYD